MATTSDDITRRPPRPDTVSLTIDGQEVVCDRGDTVLVAAQKAGVHIPTLCYEPRLPAIAACRICIVEIEGARKLTASCTAMATEGMVVRTNTERARSMRHLYLELLLSDHNSFCTPPCRDACPTHIKIPQFLDYIAHKDYKNGVRKLREDLPFPAILGRVCPRPCESPCRRQLVEAPITICQLHRFMGDQCLDEEQNGELLLPVEPKPDSGKRLAVVGAGPAGLAAAFYARLEGHAVRVFEALPKPGGMLRYRIPGYRLPRDVMDKELNVLWRLGVELQVDSRLGADFQLEDLFEQGYDAVFLALGASGSKAMGIPGEDAEGVIAGGDLLRDLELGGDVRVGERVVVVGGGPTAVDAARAGLRTGARDVSCLYWSSRDEMPAFPGDVEAAEAEGVRFEFQIAPVRVVTGDDGRVAGLEVQQVRFGEPDASGARQPVPVDGSRSVIACDEIIVAVGGSPELGGTSPEQGVQRTAAGTIAVDKRTFQAAEARIFAGGDAVLGAPNVIEAVAQGKKAAWSIDAFLRGEDMAAVSRGLAELEELPFFTALTAKTDLDPRISRMAEIEPAFIDMTTDVTHPSPPAEMPRLAPAERRADFSEVELGFSEDEAVRGADLCLQCYCPASGKCDLQRYGIEYEVFKNRFHGGQSHDYAADFRHDFIMREPNRCINCGRCVRVCRMEVGSNCYDQMGRGFDTIVSTADNLPLQTVGCVSCGKCAETCPTGSIETNPRLLTSYDLDESRCIFCGECVEVCPYDALEQTDFFELAGFSRTTLARESLYVREPRRVDPLRETVKDLVPNVRDAELGRGWTWAPIKADPITLDDPEERA
ncbi:MAG: FAD-dependent oxidoreductase [Thermoleophilia bacterium]